MRMRDAQPPPLLTGRIQHSPVTPRWLYCPAAPSPKFQKPSSTFPEFQRPFKKLLLGEFLASNLWVLFAHYIPRGTLQHQGLFSGRLFPGGRMINAIDSDLPFHSL